MNQTNTILTDDRVIAITISLVSLLFTALIACAIWIFNKVLSEIKAVRQERVEFIKSLNSKFETLDLYAKETDEMQIRHEEKISNLNENVSEIKRKLLNTEDKLYKQGEKILEHGIRIANIKGGLT